MSKYVVLWKYTQQGLAAVDKSADRVEAHQSVIERPSAAMIDRSAGELLGRQDHQRQAHDQDHAEHGTFESFTDGHDVSPKNPWFQALPQCRGSLFIL